MAGLEVPIVDVASLLNVIWGIKGESMTIPCRFHVTVGGNRTEIEVVEDPRENFGSLQRLADEIRPLIHEHGVPMEMVLKCRRQLYRLKLEHIGPCEGEGIPAVSLIASGVEPRESEEDPSA